MSRFGVECRATRGLSGHNDQSRPLRWEITKCNFWWNWWKVHHTGPPCKGHFSKPNGMSTLKGHHIMTRRIGKRGIHSECQVNTKSSTYSGGCALSIVKTKLLAPTVSLKFQKLLCTTTLKPQVCCADLTSCWTWIHQQSSSSR